MKEKPAFLRWIIPPIVTGDPVLTVESYGQPLKGKGTSPAKLSSQPDSKSMSGSANTSTMAEFSRLPKPDVEVYSRWYTKVTWDPRFR